MNINCPNNTDMTINFLSTQSKEETQRIGNTRGQTESHDSGRESLHNESDEENLFKISTTKQPLLSLPGDNFRLDVEKDCDYDECDTASVTETQEFADDLAANTTEPAAQTEHYLNTPWSMYYRANKKSEITADYKSLETTKIAKVETIEDFWKVINHMQPPTKIQKRIGPNLMFFRDNIFPEWEDPENVGGGTWGLILTSRNYREMLNALWIETLLACIGEAISHSEYITGVVLQRRQREDRIQVWTKDASEEEIQIEIGKCFKKLLNLQNSSEESIKLWYTRHNDMENISANHRPGQGRWSSKGKKDREQHQQQKNSESTEDTVSPRGSHTNLAATEPTRMNSRAPRRGYHSNSSTSPNGQGQAQNKNGSIGNTSYSFMLEKLDRLHV